jgi:hypothetical protein
MSVEVVSVEVVLGDTLKPSINPRLAESIEKMTGLVPGSEVGIHV